MKESYVEGLATHDALESRAVFRKGSSEALTGVRAGRVLSRESESLQDADAMGEQEGFIGCIDIARASGSCAVGNPVHVRKHFTREPGSPVLARV
jgi:hypothetical protein